MKTLYKIFFFFLVFAASHAQSSGIEAHDLLQKLIPKSGQAATFQSAKDAVKGVVKWTKPNPTKEVLGYNLFGEANVSYNKQPIKCDGKVCETGISLIGKTAKTYDEIGFNFAPDALPTLQLDKLFGKKPDTFKILKKDLDGLGGVIYYEVQFSGKPLVWIQVMTIPAYREEQSNDFSLTVFFNKKAMMARMN